MEIIHTAETLENSPEYSNSKNEEYTPLAGTNSASRKDALDSSSPLKLAETSTHENETVLDIAKRANDVVITEDDKNRFLDAVIKGTRFYSYVSLFGGSIRVKLRSRTLAETEAIMSYVHRKGILGELETRSDVSDTLLSALLVAQVEEVGDVSYPEMKTPYKYVETATDMNPPGWLEALEMWRSKPEHLTSAIGDALIDFEAKYWKMVAASKDENFWNPGGSTGS